MSYCEGSFMTILGRIQGACGSSIEHGEHEYDPAEAVCPGAPAGVQADCGSVVAHTTHSYDRDGAR